MNSDSRAIEEFELFLAAIVERQAEASVSQQEEARLEIQSLSRRLVALERRLRDSAMRQSQLEDMRDIRLRAREEYERVLAVPGILSLKVDEGSQIEVRTSPIEIEWEGTTYGLGSYRMTLDMDGDIALHSVQRLGPKPHWDHPHVQDSLPCLGNLRPGVLKLIAEYEIGLAVQVLMDFLRTYQPETAYCPIEGWPSK